MSVTLPKGHKISSIARPTYINPNSDFWFENIPPGNPDWKPIENENN
jgi:hypothetical protein